MINVSVILQSAITGQAELIAMVEICNDGDGSAKVGNYTVRSYRGRSQDALLKRQVQRNGRVLGHRRQDEHVLNLVAKSLKALGYGD